MRQILILLAVTSCLVSVAASAQSQSGTAPTASARASATTDRRAVDLPASSQPASNATRAIANFTSLLREAALQAQAASQNEPAPATHADPGKPVDPDASSQASRPRVAATSPA